MRGSDHLESQWFRIWIAGYDNWRPRCWNDVPPHALALEPAAPLCLASSEARLFLEGFNSRMLSEAKQIWAVALPVELRWEGDARPGEMIQGHRFEAMDPSIAGTTDLAGS